MIWFSASWILIILPNSVGLSGFPLRMISLVCSNRLTILPAELVTPWMIRARVWLTTCCTRGSIVSSSFFRPSKAACCNTSAERLTPLTISCEKGVKRVKRSADDSLDDLLREAFGLSHHLSGGAQQLAIPCSSFF